MLDRNLLARQEKWATIDTFLRFSDLYQAVKIDGPRMRTVAELADMAGMAPNALTNSGDRLAKNLNVPDPVDLLRRPDAATSRKVADYFSRIDAVLLAYQNLLQHENDATPPLLVRMATTHFLSVRLMPQLQSAAQKLMVAETKYQPVDVQVLTDDLRKLIHPRNTPQEVDYILAYSSNDDSPATMLELKRVELQRCLLANHNNSLAKKPFTGWSDLSDQSLICVPNLQQSIDWDWNEIRGTARDVREVQMTLEAHALVEAGRGVAFSHRELLSESEEKYLHVVPMTGIVESDQSSLKLWRRKGFFERRSKAERRYVEKWGDAIAESMASIAVKSSEARKLTGLLSRFPYCYHISDYYRKGQALPQRSWFPGQLLLEATPTECVKGHHFIKQPIGHGTQDIRIFGRLVKTFHPTTRHLIWRGTDATEESGTTSLIVSQHDLETADHLVGYWLGRTSWVEDSEIHPASGPMILHSHNNVSVLELNEILANQQARTPLDLTAPANSMIGMQSTCGETRIGS